MSTLSSCPSPLRVAAFFGFTGVLLGAFGAHALRGTLELHGMRSVWETAVLYQFVHAAAILFLSREEAPRWIGTAFTVGIVLFSGSLYVLALGGPHWLGPLTPLGGLGFLAGWLGLFLYAGRKRP